MSQKIDPDHAYSIHLRRYNITLEQYRKMLLDQGGKCAIPGCGVTPEMQGKRLSVDHDHQCCAGKTSCGKCIRSLLCSKCHKAGRFIDNDLFLEWLRYFKPFQKVDY